MFQNEDSLGLSLALVSAVLIPLGLLMLEGCSPCAGWPGEWRGRTTACRVSSSLAMAPRLVSQSYGGPLFLYAMFLGMAFNSVAVESRLLLGAEFTTRTLLRIGVALLAGALGLDSDEAAMLFGGTIHDVAQVVGAALLYPGEGTGEIAIYVKLLRVAMLAPVVLAIGLSGYRAIGLWARGARVTSDGSQSAGPARRVLLPPFLVGFFVLFATVNLFELPAAVVEIGTDLAQGLILLAVAGLGVKTSLADLYTLGWRPAALLVCNTIFLLGVVLAIILIHPWATGG